jgi:hypothetical protein
MTDHPIAGRETITVHRLRAAQMRIGAFVFQTKGSRVSTRRGGWR